MAIYRDKEGHFTSKDNEGGECRHGVAGKTAKLKGPEAYSEWARSINPEATDKDILEGMADEYSGIDLPEDDSETEDKKYYYTLDDDNINEGDEEELRNRGIDVAFDDDGHITLRGTKEGLKGFIEDYVGVDLLEDYLQDENDFDDNEYSPYGFGSFTDAYEAKWELPEEDEDEDYEYSFKTPEDANKAIFDLTKEWVDAWNEAESEIEKTKLSKKYAPKLSAMRSALEKMEKESEPAPEDDFTYEVSDEKTYSPIGTSGWRSFMGKGGKERESAPFTKTDEFKESMAQYYKNMGPKADESLSRDKESYDGAVKELLDMGYEPRWIKTSADADEAIEELFKDYYSLPKSQQTDEKWEKEYAPAQEALEKIEDYLYAVEHRKMYDPSYRG